MRTLTGPAGWLHHGRWTFLVGCSLIAVSCSKSEEATSSADPKTVALQAQAAQNAISSAQAAHEQHDHASMAMQGDAGGAQSPPSTPGSVPPMKGSPTTATGNIALMGHPAPMNATEQLPSAEGAPHLYHIGAEGFFLAQGSAVGLTPEQQGKLATIKEKTERAHAATQRKIVEAENALWTLTAAEKPDVGKIDAKISEIGRLGAQQRSDFVRAVGSAVAVLNDAQRKAVIALGPAATPSTAPSPPMNTGTAPAAGAMPMGDDGGMPMGDDGMEDDKPMKTPMAPKAPMAPKGMGHM